MNVMREYAQAIRGAVAQRKTAFTKRYPLVLPVVLEARRTINSFIYLLNPKYFLKKGDANTIGWRHITDHSSPLFRKYNHIDLDRGKIENIKIAIKGIDGLVIPPGKIFSFWKAVGRPSKARGFQNGLLLSDGKSSQGIGGGLCQLSNLIAYMFACSECAFIERRHHSRDTFPDSGRNIPFASGATVFYNLIDLKVKNTYPFPIRLNVHVTDTQLRGSISASQSLDYVVKVEERDAKFIRICRSGNLYRCNRIFRVFYEKGSRQKKGEQRLWTNVAKVMYDAQYVRQCVGSCLDIDI